VTVEGAAPDETGKRSTVISPEAAYRALAKHPLWIVERDRIHRDVRFPSFRAAMRFVDRVAEIAERLGHHPNIWVHEWCFVRLDVYSHASGQLAMNDVDLAIAIDDETGDLVADTDG
jgi:4a-hydroxytetrahydrobiopterin dehydratase